MKTTNPTIDLLRTVHGLHGRTDRQLERLCSLVTHCRVEEGQVLAREGTPARQAFIVVKGSGTVSVQGTPIASFGPGDFIGEMAMLDHQPRCATAWADTPMEVLVVGPSEFGSFIDDSHVAQAIALQLTARLRELETAHR